MRSKLFALTIVCLVIFPSLVQAITMLTLFPEVNGPFRGVSFPFPAPIATVGTANFSIPSGHKIVSATISGIWGSTSIGW